MLVSYHPGSIYNFIKNFGLSGHICLPKCSNRGCDDVGLDILRIGASNITCCRLVCTLTLLELICCLPLLRLVYSFVTAAPFRIIAMEHTYGTRSSVECVVVTVEEALLLWLQCMMVMFFRRYCVSLCYCGALRLR